MRTVSGERACITGRLCDRLVQCAAWAHLEALHSPYSCRQSAGWSAAAACCDKLAAQLPPAASIAQREQHQSRRSFCSAISRGEATYPHLPGASLMLRGNLRGILSELNFGNFTIIIFRKFRVFYIFMYFFMYFYIIYILGSRVALATAGGPLQQPVSAAGPARGAAEAQRSCRATPHIAHEHLGEIYASCG